MPMPTKKDFEALKSGIKKIEVLKAEISKKRDELRAAVSDVEEIVESLEEAAEGLEDGLRSLNEAADAMSQFL